MSETESDDETPLTFEPLQQELEDMLEVLDQTIESLHKVKKEVCETHNLFEDLHLKFFLHEFLMNWKAEGRLSPSGSSVVLNEAEAYQLHLPFTNQPVSIYMICCAMVEVLLEKHCHSAT
jgi:hypothetical protein